MNIIVLIKEVPDMERVRFDRERGLINRTSSTGEINPFDLYALQTAVDLRSRYGAHVTAVSMGPEQCENSLRDAWARGADACVQVTDKRFAGADTYATSRVLAATITRMKFDLILCGEKTVDGDTAQVGAEVAEILSLPHSYYVESIIDVNDGYITLTTSDICGSGQYRRMSLPALLAVGRKTAHPLLPELKRKLDSVSVGVEKVGFDKLSDILSEDSVGLKGSPTQVSKIIIPDNTLREGKIFRNDVNGFVEAVKAAAKEAGHE